MEKTGKADQDDEWTFGQVLSLTTWIPIGIELLFVYICKRLSYSFIHQPCPFPLQALRTANTELTIV